MNGMYDGQATGKRGHGNTLAWPQPPVKLEQHAGLGGGHGLGAQANGVGIAMCKGDRHQHHHPSPPHYHLPSKDCSQEAPSPWSPTPRSPPNPWHLEWMRTREGAAAAVAAAAAARGRLGQWARLRREARGGGILLPQEMEALGQQYSCLEHEFQGFKRKWPELDAEAANRRALRRAHSAQPQPSSSHIACANGAAGGRAPSQSRPRTAPSTAQTQLPAASRSTSRGPSNRPGARTPERRPISNHLLHSPSNSSKLPAHGTARTPARRARSPLPSSAAQPQQQRAPSRNRSQFNALHQTHLHPVAQQQHSRLPPASARNARTPEHSRNPLSTHVALSHAQPPSSHHPSKTFNKHSTPERSRPPAQASQPLEQTKTGQEALALLTPLHTQRQHKPQQQQQQQQQQHGRTHTSSAADSCSSPSAFAWHFEGGTPAYSPFGHPLFVGDMGSEDDDDEDPFSMPPSFMGPGRSSDSSAMLKSQSPHDATSNGGTPGHHRHVRQSSELLLPSLGSLSAMLAATSNPNTPRDNTHHHKTHSTPPQQLQPQHQQQQQHTQHARLMQRRLVQEQRRLEKQQQQQHGITTTTAAPFANHPHTLTVRTPSTAAPHSSTFHLHQHSPPSSPAPATQMPNGSARAGMEPTHRTSSHQATRRASQNGGSCSKAATADLSTTTPSPKLPGSTSSSGNSKGSGREEVRPPKGGSGRARVLAMAAALSEASSPVAARHTPASPPHTSSPLSFPQLGPARKGVGNGTAAAAAGVQGENRLEGVCEGRRKTAPAATAAVEGGRHPMQARKAGGWTPGGKGSNSSSGGSNGGTGRALHAQTSNKARADTTTAATKSRSRPTTPLANAKSSSKAHASNTRHSPALPSSRIAVPRTPTAPPSTFSAAAAAASAIPSSANTNPKPLNSRKPASSKNGTPSTTSTRQRQHTPLHTKTSVGHLTTHPPSHLTRLLHPSSNSDLAAAALAAAAASLSTARTRSALSSPAGSHRSAHSAVDSPGSAAGSSAHNSPRPSHSGAASPNQMPLPTRTRTRVQRGGAAGTSPTTPSALATSPPLQHNQPMGSPFFCTPASHTNTAFGGRDNDSTSRRDSSSGNGSSNTQMRKRTSSTGGGGLGRVRGGLRRCSSTNNCTSPGGQQYLQRLQRDAHARRATTAGAPPPTETPALLASPLSPSPSMRTARSSDDASAHTTPNLTPHTPSALHPLSTQSRAHPHPHTTTFSPDLNATHSSSSSSSSGSRGAHHAGHMYIPHGGKVHQHRAGRLTTPNLMGSLPSDLHKPGAGVRGSDGDAAGVGGRWDSYTASPPSSQLGQSHDHAEEDLLPLMQLSAVRQSRMSAASSTSSQPRGFTSHTTPTPNAFASPPSHSPLRKSRASDSIAMQQPHQNHHHHRHASVTFQLPPTPTSEAAHTPFDSLDKPLTSSASPHNLAQRHRPFRLSSSSPLSHSFGARQRSQSPLLGTNATLAGSPSAGASGEGGRNGRLGGSRSGAGTRLSPPPACTPNPFTALQSKSFTAGGALVTASHAAEEQSHHHPQTTSQPQQQPAGHSLFDSGSCAALDEDADVELVSRGGSGSSHHSGLGNPWAMGCPPEGHSKKSGGPETNAPRKLGGNGSHTIQQQQQQQKQQQQQHVHAPATTANPPNPPNNASNDNSTANTTSPAKQQRLGGGLASYWSRLFSRAPAQPHPANMVGETA